MLNKGSPATPAEPSNYYIGLMSGTSADAVDAVVVALTNDSWQLLASQQTAIDRPIQTAIRQLMQPQGVDELARCAHLDTQLGFVFANAALSVMQLAGLSRQNIRAIGSHGQTLRHAPENTMAYSIQIGQPAVIAEQTGITTVAQFRQADLAAGGQGAPLAPLFHQAFFSTAGIDRVLVNIGGIANISTLPGSSLHSVTGFDCGPGNTLLDTHCRQILGQDFDRDGQWAATGKVHQALLNALCQDPFFSQPPPKSTGLEYFHSDWLQEYIGSISIAAADLQATLLELTASSIAQAINRYAPLAQEVYVCGGGSHNRFMMQRIQHYVEPLPLLNTAALGLEPDWVEAAGFAWLACQTLAKQSVNTVTITGAQHLVIAGAIYLANRP